jgi:hypothetical protein
MAHGLRIVYGSTTINLNSGRYALLEYVPRTPESTSIDVESVFNDGGEQPLAAYRNVVEVARVALLDDGSATNLQSDKRAIELALAQARRYQKKPIGDRVYVEYQPDGYSGYYRSEILDGRVELSDESTGWQWLDKNIEIRVAWKRRHYWEGAETQIPLTNGNGTNNTSGLTVRNHDDGGAGDDNYVQIAAADVAGDIDAPLRLEMTNNYNSATKASNFWIARNVLSDPANLTHILEAEAGSGGTTQADATCSGGNRKDFSWSATTEQELLSWDLSTALLNACSGNYFRVLARFLSMSYSDMWMRWRIKLVLTTIWEGPQFLLTASAPIQDLGVLQLPPYMVGAGDLYPLALVLCAQRKQSGTHYLYLDFAQLSALDGYRKLSPRGYGLEYQARIVDDGIGGFTYTDGWSPAGKTGHYVSTGERITVTPGRLQRIYFLHDTVAGSAAIERTLSVKAYYRPRRLTI